MRNPRTSSIRIRVTKDEHDQVARDADHANVTISDYLLIKAGIRPRKK